MLCLPLHVDRERLGTLSLYATRASAFGVRHERLAALFATYAALALAEARRLEHIRAALQFSAADRAGHRDPDGTPSPDRGGRLRPAGEGLAGHESQAGGHRRAPDRDRWNCPSGTTPLYRAHSR